MYNDIYEVMTKDDLVTLDEKLVKTEPLYIDVEGGDTVDGKDYYNLVSIQLYQEHWEKVMWFEMSQLPSYATEFIFSTIVDLEWIGHNLMTEFKYINRTISSFTHPDKWGDTFYASRLIFPSWQEYSLDKCLTKVLGYDPYARMEIDKKTMQKSFSYHTVTTHEQRVYGSLDVYLLPKLWNKVKQVAGNFNYELDKKIAIYSMDVAKKGMPVDVGELDNYMVHFKSEVVRTEAILGLNDKGTELNVNSYIQVRKVLGLEYSSDELALKVLAYRPTGLEGHIHLLPFLQGSYLGSKHFKATVIPTIRSVSMGSFAIYGYILSFGHSYPTFL